MHYYNEIDTHCCRVLASHIGRSLPFGILDAERSIEDVQPSEVADYQECHFFAGIGGFPLGFYRAGLSGVNVWTGGFPCQDLSVAGNRAGLAGERSGLWFEFYRLLTGAKPDWVVIENVPGLLSSNGGRDFAVILSGLVKLGYGVCWRVLDAQYYGVPQRRRRVFIVGHLGDGRAAQVLFEREGGAWDPPPSREAGARVADPVATSPYADNESQHRKLVPVTLDSRNLTCVEEITNTLQSKKTGGYSLNYQPVIAFDRTRGTSSGDISAPLRACGGRSEGVNDAKADAQCVAFEQWHADTKDWGGTREEWERLQEMDAIAFEPRYFTRDNKTGGAPSEAPSITNCHKAGDSAPCVAFTERTRAEGRTLEMSPELSYALTNPGSGGRTHSRQTAGDFGVRRLTPTECERLQGFPDGWTAGQSDTQRHKQLGNAVAVPVIEWIGRRIMEAEQLSF